MSTLRTTNVIHGSSAISNIVLDNQGRAIFGPDGPQGRAALYVNAQTNRVGVNNESPAVALDVDGAINATGNATIGGTLDVTGNVSLDNLDIATSIDVGNIASSGVSLNNGGYIFVRQPTTNGRALDIYNASGSTAYIRGDGVAKLNTLGIGTTSPTAQLQIVPTAVDTAIFGIRRIDSTTINLFTFFQDSNIAQGAGCAHLNTVNRDLLITASADAGIDSGLLLTTTGNLLVGCATERTINSIVDIPFQVQQANGSGSGRIAIGTNNNTNQTGPAVYLYRTRGGVLNSNTVVQDDDDLGSIYFQGANGTNVDSRAAQIRCTVNGTPTSTSVPGDLSFSTTPPGSSSVVERYRIDTNGTHFFTQRSTADGSALAYFNAAGNSVQIRRYNCGSNADRTGLYFQNSGITNTRFWVDDSAIVRVSNADPTAANSGTVVGTQTSDERVKNIFGTVGYGLEEIKKIEPITFALKSEPETRKIGFSAQQVLDVVPEAVYDTDEYIEGQPREASKKLAMEYVALIPVLVNAIKELSTELDALKAKQ